MADWQPPEVSADNWQPPEVSDNAWQPPEVSSPSSSGYGPASPQEGLGLLAGVADTALSIPFAVATPITQGLAIGATKLGLNNRGNIPPEQLEKEIQDKMNEYTNYLPGKYLVNKFGSPATQQTYQDFNQAISYPFEKINEGATWLANKADWNPATTRVIANIGLLAAPEGFKALKSVTSTDLPYVRDSSVNEPGIRPTYSNTDTTLQGPNRVYNMPTPGSTLDYAMQQLWETESSNNPNAVSSAGAQGIGQMMPGTARQAAAKAGVAWDPQRYSTDVDYQKQLSAAHFQSLLDKYNGDYQKSFAAYNAGEGWVDAAIKKAGETGDWFQELANDDRSVANRKQTAAYVAKNMQGLVDRKSMNMVGPEQPTQPIATGNQGELFGIGDHTAFDKYSPYSETPKPLTREEFQTTMENLTQGERKVPGMEMPEDMDAAYTRYLEDASNPMQQDFLNRDSQQAAFNRVNTGESILRSQDQMTPQQLDLAEASWNTPSGPNLFNATERSPTNIMPTEAPQMAPMGPEYTPGNVVRTGLNQLPQVEPRRFTDQGAQAATQMADIPGMDNLGKMDVAGPEPTVTVKPIEQATADIPGLSKEAASQVFQNLSPEEAKTRALTEEDIKAPKTDLMNALSNNFRTGLSMLARRTGNTIIKMASQYFENANQNIAKFESNIIKPVHKAFFQLDKQSRIDLHSMLMEDLGMGEPVNRGALDAKTLAAYDSFRKMTDQVLDRINQGRATIGMEPMTRQDMYVTQTWQGRFTARVYDPSNPTKSLIFLKSNTARGLQKQVDHFQQKLDANVHESPESVLRDTSGRTIIEKLKPQRGYEAADTMTQSYNDMLRILDPGDPRVAVMDTIYKDGLAKGVFNESNVPVHFKDKSGTRGFLGDNPIKTDIQNANDLLNAQIQYAREANNWSAHQEAVQKLGNIISDSDIRMNQPNAVAIAQQYAKHAIGMANNQTIRRAESVLTDALGTSHSQVQNVLNMTKAGMYASTLGFFNLKNAFVNLLQPLNMLPHITFMESRGLHADPVKTVGDMGAAMFEMYRGKEISDPVIRDAVQWAQDQKVLDINSTHEIGDLSSHPLVEKVSKTANFLNQKVENVTRTQVFMTMITHLRQSGLTGDALHNTAAALLNDVMVDYSKQGRPAGLDKIGLTGNAMAMFKTFQANWWNQFNMFAREAGKGNYAPLAEMMAIQWGIAGFIGIPAAEQVLDLIDNMILPHTSFAGKSIKDQVLLNSPKMASYGPLSSLTGIDFQSSTSQGQPFGSSGLGYIAPSVQWSGKIAGQLLDGNMLGAVYQAAPALIKGGLDARGAMDRNNGLSQSVNGSATIRRTPTDTTLRALGMTSLNESMAKSETYTATSAQKAWSDRQKSLMQDLKNAEDQGDQKGIAQALVKLRAMGYSNPINVDQTGRRNMDMMQRATPRSPSNIQEAQQAEIMRRIRQQNGY